MRLHVWALTAACLLSQQQVVAQEYPTRPIRFIVPFAPGGGTDIVARKLAAKLTGNLGQTVFVENKPGGSGVLGTDAMAKSPADGYTILIATATFTINPGVKPSLPYDTLRDFAPVSLVATTPYALALNSSLPARSVKELVAMAKAQPGKLNFSSAATGGSSHLYVEFFNSLAGINMVHVPYKSTGESVLAVVKGEVSLTFSDIVTVVPQVNSGRLRALAVTGSKRSPQLPGTPNMAELGYSGFEAGGWYGIVTRAGTPQPIINRLYSALSQVVNSPDFERDLEATGATAVGTTPAAFGQFLRAEVERWTKVVKDGNIKIE